MITIGSIEIFKKGSTPYSWATVFRIPFRIIQKSVYKTWRLIPFIIIGIILVALTRKWASFISIGAVPAYYLMTHSAFSTEYRYILAIHCFLFIFAAIGIYITAIHIKNGLSFAWLNWLRKKIPLSRGKTSHTIHTDED
jgi:hypothetical protein